MAGNREEKSQPRSNILLLPKRKTSLSCPFNWPEFPWSQLDMTFIKALGPIFARGPHTVIDRKNLEGRRSSASDCPRQISE
jgi:hypothetical protein